MASMTDASPDWPTALSRPATKEQTQRIPKLRASCDACAASKVRCSKDHPICARCTSNGITCVYGPSRKHGKPGRVRKKNPDGTPAKPAARRKSAQKPRQQVPDVKVRAEPLLPDVEEDVYGVHHSFPNDYFRRPSFSFLDDAPIFTGLQDHSNAECIPTIEAETMSFEDHFAKNEHLNMQSPVDPSLSGDFQALRDFIGGDAVQPMDISLDDTHFVRDVPQTPDSPMGAYLNSRQESIPPMTEHNCYNLAYTTLESLHFRCPGSTFESSGVASSASTPRSAPHSPQFDSSPKSALTYAAHGQTLDSVLSKTKTAVQNVLRLLSCPCAADPHLAMLYASITSKIINWYQIAAGVRTSSTPVMTPTLMPSTPSSTSSSAYSTSYPYASTIKFLPLTIGAFSLDEEDQEVLRRQVLLRELSKAGQMVEALANWRAPGGEEESGAEFLYDMLGAWLKSELFRTITDVKDGVEV